VVAGYNVFLVLELGESIHRKGETNNSSSCEVNENSVNHNLDSYTG
jgi:hypothetical protein